MLTIDDNLLKDIEKYCKINNIEDINKEINNFLRKGFNLTKFGSSPFERIEMEQRKEPPQAEKKEEVIQPSIIEEKPLETAKTIEIQPIISATTIEEVNEVKPKRKYTRKVRLLKDE